MMRIVKNIFIAILLCLLSVVASAETYAIVTGASNDFSADDNATTQIAKRLFLKEKKDWPNGLEAKVFDRNADSPEQSAFTKNVLQMSKSEVAEHWLNLKQKTGETPPREVGSTRMLMKFLEKYPGGLSVIKVSEAEGANVRVLLEISD